MQCVKRLLELGIPTIAVVRSPEKYADTFDKSEQLQIKQGDVQNVASLKSVLQDGKVKHVIFSASGKTYWSAKDVDEQVQLHLPRTACVAWSRRAQHAMS